MTARIRSADPGAHGAIVLVNELGNLIELHNMPALEETAGRPATDATSLAAGLAKTRACTARRERVSTRLADARKAAFAFGRAASAKAQPPPLAFP